MRRELEEFPRTDGGESETPPPGPPRGQAFDERHNLAALDADLPRASVWQVLKHYAASVTIYGCLLAFFKLNPWFTYLLATSSHGLSGFKVYEYLLGTYVVLAPVVLLAIRPRSLWTSKNLLVLGFLGRLARGILRGDIRQFWSRFRPDYKERNALMFLLIKIIYGPLMLHSAFLELRKYPLLQFQLQFQPDWLETLDVWFLMFVSGVFLLDSITFFIGYTTEAGVLRNRLRYAETNVFRILVCIACYGPFNLVTASILGPSNQDVRIVFQGQLDHPVTWILRICAALALLGLISATLSLCTRASNLTNRGIVTYGPYALVRHPGYISKNVFWLTTIIPLFFADTHASNFSWTAHTILCVQTLAGWLAWGTLYFLRAITEEQFLSRDPDYVAYCQKVRYRLIPWIY